MISETSTARTAPSPGACEAQSRYQFGENNAPGPKARMADMLFPLLVLKRAQAKDQLVLLCSTPVFLGCREYDAKVPNSTRDEIPQFQ